MKLLMMSLFAALLVSCSTSKPCVDRLVVSVDKQVMQVLCEDGHEIERFPVSTSRFGEGNKSGSYKTPIGKHEIVEKIGDGLPAGTILKGRKSTGMVAKSGAFITSRILRLKGEERQNSNTYRRSVYIHGTSAEDKIGKKASIGCVRMKNKDIIELFAYVKPKTKVEIVKNG